MKTWGRFWFLVFIWSTLTQPIKKFQWYIPFRRQPLGGGEGLDETGSLFPAGSGFRRSEAPERQTPRKIKVVPQHMCTIVLLVVNGKDPTQGFDRLHRHQFLPSEFVEVELEIPPSSEPEGIL